jgi:SAM-dependent methyltransferase
MAGPECRIGFADLFLLAHGREWGDTEAAAFEALDQEARNRHVEDWAAAVPGMRTEPRRGDDGLDYLAFWLEGDDPIDLMFAGMPKLGPGSDEATREALARLPRRDFSKVVDLGCGSGRQTLVLARELGVPVHAVDLLPAFLAEVDAKAREAGLGDLVQTRRLDMADLALRFEGVDLLWCESAIYNLGFGPALRAWKPALAPGACVVASELCWTTEEPPDGTRDFFAEAYPAMTTVAANRAAAEDEGYEVLDQFELPASAWTEGYYDRLGPRAQVLLQHQAKSVRAFARETLDEIALFEEDHDSYAYVFFLMRLPD